jgi:hypothetical protein
MWTRLIVLPKGKNRVLDKKLNFIAIFERIVMWMLALFGAGLVSCIASQMILRSPNSNPGMGELTALFVLPNLVVSGAVALLIFTKIRLDLPPGNST